MNDKYHSLNRLKTLIVSLLVAICLISSCNIKSNKVDKKEKADTFITPLGKEYAIAEPSGKMLEQYLEAKKNFEQNPDDLENIIWYGRRTAYLGQYKKAIEIYSNGLKKYPNEPRLLRHRGHRYISLRQFDKAIQDLEKAGQLIEGTENKIEQDGMPNAMNIPVSTLHGNIWYHLGLAYYLVHDYEKSFDAYLKCRASGSNADNIVSSTHWLYMNQRRLGNQALADEMLEPITEGLEVIENQSYYNLCLMYKDIIPVDSVIYTDGDASASDAVKYGVANWYFYNGEKEKAQQLMEEIVQGKSWSSFGYIAAESDLLKYFKE